MGRMGSPVRPTRCSSATPTRKLAPPVEQSASRPGARRKVVTDSTSGVTPDDFEIGTGDGALRCCSAKCRELLGFPCAGGLWVIRWIVQVWPRD